MLLAAIELNNDSLALMIPIVVIVCVFTMISIGIIGDVIRKTADRKEIEKSRREIAAYIAEGSISPDEGEKLLSADPKRNKKC